MKFTDGYWLMRRGCTPRFAAEVADVRAGVSRMTLHAPVKHVTRRGGTAAAPSSRCPAPARAWGRSAGTARCWNSPPAS
ncbi:hypothetical protein [Streptomyces sp. NPDC093984]|uniref:hypothetical protein n=1 Tax=Streptomyces sp. NPDC093984 TaxID=3366052 RepID=UPI0037F2FDF3